MVNPTLTGSSQEARKKKKKFQEKPIIYFYDCDHILGKLLILGYPGSGKTTTLFQLGKVLVQRAEDKSDQPIPIYLKLSSWKKDNQSIEDWIIETLRSDGCCKNWSKELVKTWLREGIIVPLLDGLNELAPNRQVTCINYLNNFIDSHPFVVVTSRYEEYKVQKTKLSLYSSITLLPLTETQIKDYAKNEAERIWWILWKDINKEQNSLLELVKYPLFLTFFISSASKISTSEFKKQKKLKEIETYLLDAYISQQFDYYYYGKQSEQKKAKKWLGWLAFNLEEEFQTEFLIENLKVNYLNNKLEKFQWGQIQASIFGIVFGTIGGLFYAMIGGFIFQMSELFLKVLISGFLVGILVGIIAGIYEFIFESDYKINPIEKIDYLSLLKKRNVFISSMKVSLINGIRLGMLYGFSVALCAYIATKLIGGPVNGFVFGSIYGLSLGLTYGLIEGLNKSLSHCSSSEEIESPNQGIKRLFINSIIVAFICSIIVSLIFILSTSFDFNPKDYIYILLFTFILSFTISEESGIKHLSLRFLLILKNYGPWNYAKFLGSPKNQKFIRKIKGRYQFIHPSLQEHFKEIYSKVKY